MWFVACLGCVGCVGRDWPTWPSSPSTDESPSSGSAGGALMVTDFSERLPSLLRDLWWSRLRSLRNNDRYGVTMTTSRPEERIGRVHVGVANSNGLPQAGFPVRASCYFSL